MVNLCQGQGPESLNAKGILEMRCDPWDPWRPEVPLAERTPPEPESHRIHLGNGQDGVRRVLGERQVRKGTVEREELAGKRDFRVPGWGQITVLLGLH